MRCAASYSTLPRVATAPSRAGFATTTKATTYSDSSTRATGTLELGDGAVWVGVVSKHRDEAFKACRYIIDELKHRLPIWKKEHYANGDSGWVNCERCAAAS